MKRPWLAVAIATACVAGCSVGPRYVVPAVPGQSTGSFVSVSSSVDASHDVPDDWWRLYDDEALSRLVVEALAANADLRVAVANLALSRAIAQEVQAGRYPSTQASAGTLYGRNLIADSLAGAAHGHAENQTTYLGGFDVSYELDLYGRVSRSIEAATADSQAVEAARDAVRVVVAAETTRAYVAVRCAGRELQVARRSAEIADASVEIVRRQTMAGAASEFDLARVLVLADQARAQIPAFEGRQRAAMFELGALLGRVPVQAPVDVAVGAGRSRETAITKSLPVGDGAALLARRPDVRQADRRLASATARVGVATASLYPRVSFGANLDFATNDVLKGSNGVTLSIGPLISWNFPNQLAARSRIGQSDAAAAAALATFDGTVLRALKEVEQAITACDAEASRRSSLAVAEQHAQDGYRLSGMRRQEGAASQLDLLNAEQTLLGARGALAASETRLADAQVNLFKALGGGWRDPATTSRRED